MPVAPTGGLSIFVNLAILILGFILDCLKKLGFRGVYLQRLYKVVTEEHYDHLSRRLVGYGLAFSIFAIVCVTTGISIYERLTNESNYDLIAQKVNQLIEDGKPLPEKTNKPNSPAPSYSPVQQLTANNLFSFLESGKKAK